MLLILNLPLIKIWVKVMDIPSHVLYPLIMVFIYVGTIASKGNTFDLWLVILFGIIGYLGKRFGYPSAPFVLAFILGDMLEKNLRRAMAMGQGHIDIFWQRPISVVLIGLIVLVLFYPLVADYLKKKIVKVTAS
jgi:putative tricarboxylic transport membrane protein